MGSEKGPFRSWLDQALEANQTGLNARLLDSGGTFNLCLEKGSVGLEADGSSPKVDG